MINLNILASPNIQYFGDLHPFRKWRKNIREAGINVEIYYDHTRKELLSSEHLLVHHRYFDYGWANALNTATDANGDFIKFLKHLRSNVGRLIWFDASDSSGTTQFPVIPHVDVFVKKQVLKDKSYYAGNPNELKNVMVWSNPLANQKTFIPCAESELNKIRVGWNIAYNDYRDFVVHYRLRKLLSHFINYKTYPIKFTPPSTSRCYDITFRGMVNYSSEAVGNQRNKVLEMFTSLPYKLATGQPIKRSVYLNELKSSKISISPFGLGEVCYRDFETFISGSLLVKPSMDHLEMFPHLFIPNETYIPVAWDLSDLKETLTKVLDDYNYYQDIANNGQEVYKKTINDPNLFINAVRSIL
jgi:hypothetical protein